MKGRFFIDTNILVYSFDKSNPLKQRIAKQLIEKAILEFQGCISFQVIQEFLNVATQKFEIPLTKSDCEKYLTNVLEPLCEIFSSIELYKTALEVKDGWRYSFYDSLIVAAALGADCQILYSEDLQHHQKVRDLVIVNPFNENQ